MLQAGQTLDWTAVEFLHVAPPRPPSIAMVRAAVCKRYGLTDAELRSECRKRRFSYPRQVAMYLARVITGRSYPVLGREFGDEKHVKDHTTALFAFEKIDRLRHTNPALAALLDDLAVTIAASAQAAEATVQ